MPTINLPTYEQVENLRLGANFKSQLSRGVSFIAGPYDTEIVSVTGSGLLVGMGFSHPVIITVIVDGVTEFTNSSHAHIWQNSPNSMTFMYPFKNSLVVKVQRSTMENSAGMITYLLG